MRAADTDRAIAELAARQHGLVTLDQLRQHGATDDAVHRRARRGALERVDLGTYRVPSAPITWDQRALAHCLALGAEAALSHRAAAMVWGFEGFEQAPFELTVPRGARRVTRQGTVVHASIDMAPVDRREVHRLPVTSVARTLIDLAGVTHPFRLEEALDDALARRLCTIEQVVDRFVQLSRRGRHGVAALRPLLARRAGGHVPTQSAFERRLLGLVERAGLPEPARQHPVTLPGVTVRLDLAWPERLLAVECDGLSAHGRLSRLPWDDDRQNQLVLRGWLILRFTWRQLTADPAAISAQLAEAWAHQVHLGTGIDLGDLPRADRR